jgi:hypothetical protein
VKQRDSAPRDHLRKYDRAHSSTKFGDWLRAPYSAIESLNMTIYALRLIVDNMLNRVASEERPFCIFCPIAEWSEKLEYPFEKSHSLTRWGKSCSVLKLVQCFQAVSIRLSAIQNDNFISLKYIIMTFYLVLLGHGRFAKYQPQERITVAMNDRVKKMNSSFQKIISRLAKHLQYLSM